jgi:hypothetical protein
LLVSSQPEDPLLKLAELALTELMARVKEDPTALPAHVLSKVASDAMRAIDRRDRGKIEETEPRPFDLLEELPTLPPARALGLARDEAARLESELDRVYAAIRDLEEVDGSGAVESVGERAAGSGEPVSEQAGGGGGVGEAAGAGSACGAADDVPV